MVRMVSKNWISFGRAVPDLRKHTWIKMPWNRQYLMWDSGVSAPSSEKTMENEVRDIQ